MGIYEKKQCSKPFLVALGQLSPIKSERGCFFLSLHWMYLGFFANMSHLMTKPTKWHVRQAKTQISLGICPVWSESLMSARRKLGSLATHWAHSEDSDQIGRIPRLIWVFTGRTLILLVLSRRSSNIEVLSDIAWNYPLQICSWCTYFHR